MMYPINLKVENKLCVIVGGGKAAFIKGKKLVAAGAKVMVISPSICEELKKLSIHYLCAYYHKDLMPQNTFIVVCATNDSVLNRIIAKDAEANKSLVLNADDVESSDFSVMAHQETENWGLALFTKGKAPGLSPYLCRIVAQHMEPYGQVIACLEEIRRKTCDAGIFHCLMEIFTSDRGMELLKSKDSKAYCEFIKSIYHVYMGKDVSGDV